MARNLISLPEEKWLDVCLPVGGQRPGRGVGGGPSEAPQRCRKPVDCWGHRPRHSVGTYAWVGPMRSRIAARSIQYNTSLSSTNAQISQVHSYL